jgi:hypothetical protein
MLIFVFQNNKLYLQLQKNLPDQKLVLQQDASAFIQGNSTYHFSFWWPPLLALMQILS